MNNIHLIEEKFKEDPIYKLLKNENLEKFIITNEMEERLLLGRTYTIEEVAEAITDKFDENKNLLQPHILEPKIRAREISIRNLLNGSNCKKMPLYLNAIKEKKIWHIPASTAFKIRMIFLAKEKRDYTWNQLAEYGIKAKKLSHFNEIEKIDLVAEIRKIKEEICDLRVCVERFNSKNETEKNEIEKTIKKIDKKIDDNFNYLHRNLREFQLENKNRNPFLKLFKHKYKLNNKVEIEKIIKNK